MDKQQLISMILKNIADNAAKKDKLVGCLPYCSVTCT